MGANNVSVWVFDSNGCEFAVIMHIIYSYSLVLKYHLYYVEDEFSELLWFANGGGLKQSHKRDSDVMHFYQLLEYT